LRRAIEYLTSLLAYLAAAALILMMLHVTADVVGKYVFNSPLPGTAEIVAGYYMIAAVFLPLAYVEAHDQPIVADVLFNLLGRRWQQAVLVVAYLASFAFYALLARYSWDVAMRAYQSGEFVIAYGEIIVWPSKFLLPIGLACACLALALKLVDHLRSGRSSTVSAAAAGEHEWTA
jgi:TRAP-type C4-dicarboxylate transport system permease small subunit